MIKNSPQGLIITLTVSPGASRNAILIEDNNIKVKLTVQPIENKANKALIILLSKELKLPKTSIEIIKGDTSKNKTLLLNVTNESKQNEIIVKLTKHSKNNTI